MAGYSRWPSPINNGFKCTCTYKWLGQPLFWSLKYRQLCTPDGGTVNQVILPVNTNARMDYETLRTRLASGDSTAGRRSSQKFDGRPSLNFLRVHISDFLYFLEKLSLSVVLMEPKFLTMLVGALVQVPPTDRQEDIQTRQTGTGKGSSSYAPTIIVCGPNPQPVLFCARMCLRLYMVVVLVYFCDITGSAVRHTAV